MAAAIVYPNTQATRSTMSNVLREVYTPKLWELQNRDRIMLQILNRDTENWAEGEKIHVRLHTAGSGGVGWSTGTLPEKSHQDFGDATANYRRIYGTFELDGAVMTSTRTGYAAEMRALEFEAKNLVEDLADALAYDIWQDGTGKLTGILTDPNAVAGGPSTTQFDCPTAGHGLRVGQLVDVIDADGNAGEGGLKLRIKALTASAVAGKTLVTIDEALEGSGDVDNLGDVFCYRQGSRGTAGSGPVIDGISTIVNDTGTYLGINRGTSGNEFWKAQVLDNSGTNRAVTLDLIQEMADKIEVNSPGRPTLIVTTHAIWRKIANQLVSDKRYGGDKMKLKGWCAALMFRDDIPIVRDKYCPANKIYMFDMDTWKIYQDSEGGFIDEDGQILRLVAGQDRFEAAWRRFLQLVCTDPAANGVIEDISE